jgi:hypothetical protein
MESTSRNGLGTAVNEVAEHARALVRLEGELATLELRQKVATFGAGAALLAGAVVLALYALGFALSTVAAALATFLPLWLSLLIVALAVAVVAAVLALVGVKLLRRASPPVPEQAVVEAKATTELLRSSHG